MSVRMTNDQRVSSAQQRWVESLRSKRNERERERERRKNAGLSPKRKAAIAAISKKKRSPSPATRSPKAAAASVPLRRSVPAIPTTPGPGPVAVSGAGSFCWRCGFSLPGYALFCTACGAQLNPDNDVPIPIANHQYQQQQQQQQLLMLSQSPGSLFQSPPTLTFDPITRPSPIQLAPAFNSSVGNNNNNIIQNRSYQPPGAVAISSLQHSPRISPTRDRVHGNSLPEERSTMEYLYRTLKWNLAAGGAAAGPGSLSV